jgi:hypothetical protein
MNNSRQHYIYLLYPSDIGQSGDKVFKYGRTISPETRFMGYPKNSTLIYICQVKDCYYVEDEIDYMFPRHFAKRPEYGIEYFETADVRFMIEKINELIDRLDQHVEDKDDIVEDIRKIYKKRLRFKIHPYDNMPENFTNELVEDYIGDNNDYSKYDRKIRKKKIMNIKEIRQILKKSDDPEELKLNVLYNKETKLSNDEKKVLCLFKKRAEFLNIDYKKKFQKQRYQNIIVNDDDFMKHYLLKLLINNDMMNNDNMIDDMSYEYNISNPKKLLSKIKIIKQIEIILEIKTFNIDTTRDMKKFNNEIKINDNFKQTIKRLFRNHKIMNTKTYGQLYYCLIQMYKQIFGSDLFIYKRIKINNKHHNKYIVNKDKLKTFAMHSIKKQKKQIDEINKVDK